MATDKYSEKYGQLSGADLEILGAREQAATARALRTAFKPTQGQMVGGWYVKPALTQHLADALMQYNNYKNEQAGTTEAKRLITARQTLSDEADKYGATRDVPVRPGYQVSVPAIESGTTNSLVDEALAGGYGTNEQGQPLFDAAPTPSATPSAIPNDGAQAYIPPTAEATGNVNANPTNNQYMGDPLANAVRNAPLEGAVAGANNQSAIPPVVGGQNIPQGGQASADGTMPAITVTPEPEPNRLAQMLRGEGDYAPVQKASVTDVPAVPSNFDQRVYARMLSKASRDSEAANEWKDIETQSTNEQHRLSNIATIAGRAADNIETNRRFAEIAAANLSDKEQGRKDLIEAKKEAQRQTEELTKWRVKEEGNTKRDVANIGAQGRADLVNMKLQEKQDIKDASKKQLELSAQQVLDQAGTLYNHPGKQLGTGGTSWTSVIPGTDAAGFGANLDTFKAQTFVPMVSALKGMGALSDAEGKKLTDSVGALNPKMKTPEFNDSIRKITKYLYDKASASGLKVTMPEFTDTQGSATTSPSGSVKKFNPATGKIE